MITWKMLYLTSLISISFLGPPPGPEDVSRDLNLKSERIFGHDEPVGRVDEQPSRPARTHLSEAVISRTLWP